MDIDLDLLDDDLSRAMSTDTLLAHNLVLDGLPASGNAPAEQQIYHIRGARYLIVDQSGKWAFSGLKVSKIWQ